MRTPSMEEREMDGDDVWDRSKRRDQVEEVIASTEERAHRDENAHMLLLAFKRLLNWKRLHPNEPYPRPR